MFLFLEDNIQHISLLAKDTVFFSSKENMENGCLYTASGSTLWKDAAKNLFFFYVLHLMVYGLDSMSMTN